MFSGNTYTPHDGSSATTDSPRIKLTAIVTCRNSRKLLPSNPLLTRLQENRFFYCCSLNTNHMLVSVVTKISHGLGLLIPRIPDN